MKKCDKNQIPYMFSLRKNEALNDGIMTIIWKISHPDFIFFELSLVTIFSDSVTQKPLKNVRLPVVTFQKFSFLLHWIWNQSKVLKVAK